LASLVRASGRPRQRKSPGVTRDILDRLSPTRASDRLVDARDLAILMVAFASGGRRRSEVARLRFGQASGRTGRPRGLVRSDVKAPALSIDPAWPDQDDGSR
jgi:integrase